ncbi:helix-turn-helix domain-containing protein [Ferdinandcohnia sp. SAFN-114]|uniref:helix-turn-helix domain-containing protein n=1 Tax=Ferdinandcohnia sp. SAFN-114 TaxID=3387275 RepID=UPI003F7CF85B
MYGERIRQLRKEKGLSLKELADDLGIAFTTLGNYEREEREPNFNTFEQIADYFGVSIDFLLGRREERTFDEYVLNNDFINLKEKLKNTKPEIRSNIVNAFDQLYLLVNRDLNDLDVNVDEIKHIHEIINFIFRLKNGLGWSKTQDDFSSIENSYEFTKEFLKEKQLVELT